MNKKEKRKRKVQETVVIDVIIKNVWDIIRYRLKLQKKILKN